MKALLLAVVLAAAAVIGVPMFYTVATDLQVDGIRSALKSAEAGCILEMTDGKKLVVMRSEGHVLYFQKAVSPLDWGQSLWTLKDLREQIEAVRDPTGQVLWRQ